MTEGEGIDARLVIEKLKMRIGNLVTDNALLEVRNEILEARLQSAQASLLDSGETLTPDRIEGESTHPGLDEDDDMVDSPYSQEGFPEEAPKDDEDVSVDETDPDYVEPDDVIPPKGDPRPDLPPSDFPS